MIIPNSWGSRKLREFNANHDPKDGRFTSGPGAYTGPRQLSSREAPRDIDDPTGFQDWFDGSVVTNDDGSPKRVYHGTKANFDTFEVGRAGFNSSVFGSWETARTAIFFSEDPEEASSFAMQGDDQSALKGRTGARVIPAYLSIQQPLDLIRFNGFPDDVIDEARRRGLDASYYINLEVQNAWEAFDKETGGDLTVNMLKDLGYDGVKLLEPSGTVTWAVFDGSRVKGAFNKTFKDPDKFTEGLL